MCATKGEVHNPQLNGSQQVAGFLVICAVMFLVWFALQHSTANATALQRVPPVAQRVAASATYDGFGRWGIVARPMLLLLGWVHAHVVANWGWAIVVLTALI